MFEVCLFDLDQTLIDTEDMRDLREGGKGRNDATYIEQVEKAFNSKDNRLIYSEELLARIRATHPGLKIGVFTRSPRSYAEAVLRLAFPSMKWDTIVAFEDVKKTKPYGDGIDKAMWSFGYKYISNVILVGDGDVDIRAAYHAGCVVTLDKSSWCNKYTSDNWRALSHIPDAIIDSPEELLDVLNSAEDFLPELERLLSRTERRASKSPRFDKINKFIPREVGGDSTAFPVYASGRSFSGYKSLEWRRKWHGLSKSIHDQKDAQDFPVEWVEAVKIFIRSHYPLMLMRGKLAITVIPHRPGRTPRLEAFLAQLAASYDRDKKKPMMELIFVPDLLAFKPGVKSNSNDKLGAIDRFSNIRDHLFVNRVDVASECQRVLVIDDVSTTGASLIYAKKYLNEAGAIDVTCFSMALNISNVLYD